MSTESPSTIAFNTLDLHEDLLEALDALGYTEATPIQSGTLPIALQGKDVAGQAQTGTGKTAAFLLAAMDLLLKSQKPIYNKTPGALIISPTRELAIQIYNDAVKLNQFADLYLGLVYGGVDYEKQRNQFEGDIDILIGTPGRLIDYYKQGVYDLKHTEILVLDEADRMFDLGFIKDVRYLMRRCSKPEERVSMLFSATLNYRVMELAYEHMNNPEMVQINPEQVTADKVAQLLYHVSMEDKIPLLLGLLENSDPTRSIVFVNTKRVAEQVRNYLDGNGYESAILSGDVPQKKREQLFERFSNGELTILVATDLAARGLHIPDVSHVFNYDLPQNAEDYVHRIGRTARAGASGNAVSFGCEEFIYSLMEIESYIGHKIEVGQLDRSILVEPKPPVKREREKKPFKRKRSSNRQQRSR